MQGDEIEDLVLRDVLELRTIGPVVQKALTAAREQGRREENEACARVLESAQDDLCSAPIMDYVGASEERDAQLSILRCVTKIIRSRMEKEK